MPAAPIPGAEVLADAGLVRRLVAEQFPDLAKLPVTPLHPAIIGWDNALFRLGDDLLARLPRRQLGADLVGKEQHWLPRLAPVLPLPVPVPIYKGAPSKSCGFPWPWSICPWLPGAAASPVGSEIDGWDGVAIKLADFLLALHRPAPPDAPHNEVRRGPLTNRDATLRLRLATISDIVDANTVTAQWEAGLSAPSWQGPDVWAHGDLHAGNILVDNTTISAVVDFGDLTAGDPAVDFFGAWTLLPSQARGTFRERYGADDGTWARGRAWAISLAIAHLAFSADNPVSAQMNLHAINELSGES